MCVVNKYGFNELNAEISIDPIIVNKIIIAIVETIGPIELSEKTDKQMDREEIVKSDKKETQKADKNLHATSTSFKITRPSLFKTMTSPLPNNHSEK